MRVAHGLDTRPVASQFVRERWTAQEGLTGGHVRAITQTLDGYLWIATEEGLLRFDGFTFIPISFGPPAQLSNSSILGLATDAEGDLLVRVQGAIVIRHPNGAFERLASAPGSTTSYVTAMWREHDGGVLLWDLMSGLLRYRNRHVEILANRGGSLGKIIISIAQSPDGKIWVGALGAGLSSANHGDIVTESPTVPGTKAACLLPIGQSEVLVGTDKGLYKWNGSVLSSVRLPSPFSDTQVLTLLRDDSGETWVGTTRGLVRINADGSSVADGDDSGDGAVNTLFEDREGNIWVGGADGLERIRESTFVTYPTTVDGNAKQEGPIYTDDHNRGWFAPSPGRLLLLNEGLMQAITSPFITKSVIYTISGRKDDVWLGTQHEGLFHLRYDDGIKNIRNYTHANGLAENSVYALYSAKDGTVWAGTLTGGVSKLENGRFTTYTTSDGLASNTVTSIVQTRDGTVWFGTPNGLSSLSNLHWATVGTRQGLPSKEVFCVFEDSSGILWVGTSGGLAFVRGGAVHPLQQVPEILRQPILGLAEDRKGALWIATANHVLRVAHENLVSKRPSLLAEEIREYGVDDGLQSSEGVKRSTSVTSDSQGRIWFSLSRGVSVVDPSHAARESAPALPHIEAILADNSPIQMGEPVRIPPSRKRITLTYTGLSLAEPGHIRFRYYLENFDHGWSDPSAVRDATYTNLGPGAYRFHLVASNSDGLWNGPETSIEFRVRPAPWQTWWFRTLSVVVVGAGFVFLYLIRMQQVTRQLNVRFEERLAERSRIARDLHDTLLQGVQGLILRFNSSIQHLPPATQTRDSLEKALEVADGLLLEARNQVMQLRTEPFDRTDLSKSLSKVGIELNNQGLVAFSVEIRGTVTVIQPSVVEQLFFIGREAITNAFLHGSPSEVKVEIDYGRKSLRLSCHDNGIGIGAGLLRGETPQGHWGLLGMRERSERVGGEFNLRSEHGQGTEVVVTVPARRVYVKRRRSFLALVDRLTRRIT